MLPISMVALVGGLSLPSLALVYLSIFCSIAWLPLLVIGLMKLSAFRRTGRQVP